MKGVIKKRSGPKQEVTEITTVEKEGEKPVTTVTVTEETAPVEDEETKPVDIFEVPEETLVEKVETPEGKPQQKKTTKRVIKNKIGPKLETTEIVTEFEYDKSPVVSTHNTELIIDESLSFFEDLVEPDKAQMIKEVPEEVKITQVVTITSDNKTVKTTKRVIKKPKSRKQEITEITTIENESEVPVKDFTETENNELLDETAVDQGASLEEIRKSLVENETTTTLSEQEKSESKEKSPEIVKKIKRPKLLPQKLEHGSVKISNVQFAEEITQPQFSKIKLKKPTIKPKQEPTVSTLPKIQLKSRIKFIADWPPKDVKPIITFLGSVRQNGELSRNIKEASKIKKKPLKVTPLDELDKTVLETPEDYTNNYVAGPRDKPENVEQEIEPSTNEVIDKDKKPQFSKSESVKLDEVKEKELPKKTEKSKPQDSVSIEKKKPKLKPMTIEEIEVNKPQYAEKIEEPQFKNLKLKKAVLKPKSEDTIVKIPKVQLKSRIKFVTEWPPEIIKPGISFLSSVRQNGILSRNIKEAAKIKKKVLKEPKLPEIQKTELEKPMFTHEDIIETQMKLPEKEIKDESPKLTASIEETSDKPLMHQNQKEALEEIQAEDVEEDKPSEIKKEEPEETSEDEPQSVTIKPRRPSVKKVEEITDEVTIKKKLKPVRKSSMTLPEITEPEEVTFRPKSIKTKEDVEQEFNIQLDSYLEEEISMSSKVKLKPQRQPTFNEEANEASIKYYKENEDNDEVDIIEIVDNEEKEESSNVTMPLRKPSLKKTTVEYLDDIVENVNVPKKKRVDNETDFTENVTFELGKKLEYVVDNQEIAFDVKQQIDEYKHEELSLSSNIKLASKKRATISEAADETSIRLEKEIEDDSKVEEVIISEGESEENVEMILKRKPKKSTYEVSEVEELSVELKPKRAPSRTFEEEELTISTKRKPKKKSQVQEAEASMSIAKEQEFPETPVNVRCGDTVFAVYSYVAETDEAINLVEGERLYILETTNQDWWFVRKHLTEEKGWVPAQYLMDETNYTLYLQKKLNEKIDKLPVFEKPASEEQAIAPIFIEKLRPKHTPDGATVQFECQVEGYPRPQITWFRQTAIIKPSQDFQMYYDDDNVATLVIREVFPEDAGTFTCVAKNAAGFASSTTELIVEAPLSDHGSEMTILSRKSLSRESSLADILEGIPPTFSKRPRAQYVDEGSEIFLECRLVAIPEPDIAWFFKGEEIMPNENISIATESDMHMYCSVLKISNVKKVQEGTYTVLAINREGEASLPIVLKIRTGEKEKPQVIEPLKSMTIREGDSVVLTTQVVGTPEPKVSWFKNNKPVKGLTQKSDGDIHSITIIKPKKGTDDGIYTLKATNSEGTAETSAVITIEESTEENEEPPLFINRFQELTVKEKGTIRLTAKVTGNPIPLITWYRNNQILTPSDTVTQNFDGENIELIITNVDSEIDSGDYKCVAANTAGKASHGARVTIDVDKVVFVRNLKTRYEIEEGKTVILECETSHTVSTKWYHNDKELSGMDHREIIQESRVHKLRIKRSKLSDKGTIKCVVKDQVTSTNLIVHETVPEFVRKLQDFEVKERDVAILEVEINSETADVVWEKDGEIIKPKKSKYDVEKRGTVRKLYIRNTSVHDEGEYTCKLRDDACTAEVTVVELPPEIIERLRDQKVNRGNKATFEIELTKGDALVRWFKDGEEIQFSNHIQLTIDGKKQKLKIYDCESDDEGEYSCEVGTDRCAARLAVEAPAVDFTLRLPEVLVVPARSDAHLTVELPAPDLDVTWLRRKTALRDSERVALLKDGRRRTLVLRSCTEDDEGEYSCQLLDARCTTRVKVEVIEFAPKILDYEKLYRVKRGGDVTLYVRYEANPQPNDEWVVNSKIIRKSKHTKPSIDSVAASLTIKKSEFPDAGVYKLKLENNCGKVEVDIEVVIIDIPSAPRAPRVLEADDSSVNICWLEPVDTGRSEIDCYIVEYQEENTAEWVSIENIKKTQYCVKNLKTKFSYKFRVFAVNEVGVSESSESTEYVRVQRPFQSRPPTVEKPLADTIGAPDEDVELSCIFGGLPEPKVSWYRNGQQLKTARATYVNRVATLAISASKSTEGVYRCVATNEHGNAETSCTLEVRSKPTVTVRDDELEQKHAVGDSWSVTATVDGVPRPDVTWYRNGLRLEAAGDFEIVTRETSSVIMITKLQRSHSGKYTVEAVNKAGSASVDTTLKVFDKPSKPEGPVILREISRESVTIEWKPPLDDGGLELTKYAVEKLEPQLAQWVRVADVDRSIESYCVQRLNENCEYMFRVLAMNPVGASDALESEPIIIKHALDVPSPPLGPLGFYGMAHDSVTITWHPSERNGGSTIIDYSVEIKQEGKKWRHAVTSTTTSAKIGQLATNATYSFRIYARNEIGTSLPYESDKKITIGKTLSPPSSPVRVRARDVTARSVTLQWEPPESDGGSAITNYIIEYKTVSGASWSKLATVSGAVLSRCVENLRETDALVFRVAAENAIGAGPSAASDVVHLERYATVPSPPTGPLEIRMMGNIVTTAWGTPEWDGGAPLLGYHIAIRDVTKTMWMEVGKVDVHSLKFNIKDLSEDHTYMIRIYASNEIGLSEPLESVEPFKVIPCGDSQADEEAGEATEVTEPSFSTQTTTSWLREHNMDADIRSYARGSLLRRDEYFFRIWLYAKQLFK
ncbi:unnamed protein product [Euphydryas editha]|nr:unnamed protein product [Euphydryas editha]